MKNLKINIDREFVKKFILTLLKDEGVRRLVKLIIKKLATSSNFVAWAVTTAMEELYDEFVVPVFNFVVREGFLVVDKKTGSVRLKRIKEAKVEKDLSKYIDAISDI